MSKEAEYADDDFQVKIFFPTLVDEAKNGGLKITLMAGDHYLGNSPYLIQYNDSCKSNPFFTSKHSNIVDAFLGLGRGVPMPVWGVITDSNGREIYTMDITKEELEVDDSTPNVCFLVVLSPKLVAIGGGPSAPFVSLLSGLFLSTKSTPIPNAAKVSAKIGDFVSDRKSFRATEIDQKRLLGGTNKTSLGGRKWPFAFARLPSSVANGVASMYVWPL